MVSSFCCSKSYQYLESSFFRIFVNSQDGQDSISIIVTMVIIWWCWWCCCCCCCCCHSLVLTAIGISFAFLCLTNLLLLLLLLLLHSSPTSYFFKNIPLVKCMEDTCTHSRHSNLWANPKAWWKIEKKKG